MIIKGLLLLMALAFLAVAIAWAMARGHDSINVCNNAGSHDGGRITRFAETAFTQAHLVAGKGTTAGKQVVPCAATGVVPIGFACDEADVGEPVAIEQSYGSSTLAVASAALAADVPVYTAGAGKLSSTGGSGKYLMGRSGTAAGGDGDEFEIIPCAPVLQP